MSWQERLAYELVKPRKSKLLHALLLGIAGVIVAWGVAVCILITLAVIAAILEVWFNVSI